MLKINRKSTVFTIFLWLASILLLNIISYQINQQTLNRKISSFFTTYFLISLEESMFSDGEIIVNDRNAISNVGNTINELTSNLIRPGILTGVKACTTAVYKIDNVEVYTEFQASQSINLLIPRNKIVRDINVGISCEHRISFYISSSVILSFIFLSLFLFLPYPLSTTQLDWKNYLITKGYDESEVLELARNSTSDRLALNESQMLCYTKIHCTEKRNHRYALELASQAQLAELDINQVKWFIWAFESQQHNVDYALMIAQSADIIEINLFTGSLTIHGAEISVKKTPLFYYAWYATKRLSGDGWLVNPRSNKPDYEAVAGLSTLMHQFSGHAKAIDDLENSGLKARTLDQNRSKIKDEIIAVLGDTLATPYLFQSKKDTETHRMSYRLSIQAEQITIVT